MLSVQPAGPSILRNPSPKYEFRKLEPTHSASNSSASSHASLSSASKRIRFAPLPEPDREEDAKLAAEAAAEAELDTSSFQDASSQDNASIHSMPIIGGPPSASSSLLSLTSSLASSSGNKSKSPIARLLTPFRKRQGSNSSAASTATLPSTLFSPLSRTDSRASVATAPASTSHFSSMDVRPRVPAQQLAAISRNRALNPRPTTTPAAASKTPAAYGNPRNINGVRMLNGRTYGDRRRKKSNEGSENVFANARDEEPTFVEWGYGGMGNVKSSGNENWSRIQGGNTFARHEDDGEGDGGDDGSGAAWVRKRREAREKAKREKEEEEAKKKAEEADKENISISVDLDTKPDNDHPDITTSVEPPTPVETHNMSTVTVAAPHHHHHHHVHHRNNSLGSLATVTQTASPPPPPTDTSTTTSSPDDEDDDSSTEPSESDVEDDSDTEEDAEALAEALRKTVASAGVEKISRHNKDETPKPQSP